MLAIKVKAEDSLKAEIVNLPNPTDENPLWRIVTKEIGADFMEIVRTSVLKDGDKQFVIVCDEEFLLKHSIPVPNIIGSFLYKGLICGDILIMTEGLNEDGEMDLLGLDEETAFKIVYGVFYNSKVQDAFRNFGDDLSRLTAKQYGVNLDW